MNYVLLSDTVLQASLVESNLGEVDLEIHTAGNHAVVGVL